MHTTPLRHCPRRSRAPAQSHVRPCCNFYVVQWWYSWLLCGQQINQAKLASSSTLAPCTAPSSNTGRYSKQGGHSTYSKGGHSTYSKGGHSPTRTIHGAVACRTGSALSLPALASRPCVIALCVTHNGGGSAAGRWWVCAAVYVQLAPQQTCADGVWRPWVADGV
jgi:hypothetical protein